MIAITPQHVPSCKEVRLYQDNGMYWPIRFDDDDEAQRFVKFLKSEVEQEGDFGQT